MNGDEDGAQATSAAAALVHERTDAAARRRWLIGVMISVTFGLVGVVMSVLHHLRTRDSGSVTVPSAPSDVPKERGERAAR